jgi:hypothetical protein
MEDILDIIIIVLILLAGGFIYTVIAAAIHDVYEDSFQWYKGFYDDSPHGFIPVLWPIAVTIHSLIRLWFLLRHIVYKLINY